MVPSHFADVTIPIRDFLLASRAHSDAKRGIEDLKNAIVSGDSLLLSDWKVRWIGCLALLRSAIDMFSKETRSCLPIELREALKHEWRIIKAERDHNKIYWEFLKRERDQIIHEYEWGAYEVWLDEHGNEKQPTIGTLLVEQGQLNRILRIRGGEFKGRDALSLISEAEQWVDDRIVSAIERAGSDPSERRRFADFGVAKPSKGGLMTVIGGASETN